jgi:hypothetical protein
MASPAQILANRENAQRSSGPRTIEGKQASSRNATRHGLTGAQIVMPGEYPSAYEDLRQGLRESYNPATDAERLLVDQVAANAWRLMRAQRIEAAFLTKLAEESENPESAVAAAFIDRPADLMRIQRYVAAANTAYYKAMAQLEKLQKDRAAAEYESAMMQALNPATTGFVSQLRSKEPAQPAAEYATPDFRRDAPTAQPLEPCSMLPDPHPYSGSGRTAESYCS